MKIFISIFFFLHTTFQPAAQGIDSKYYHLANGRNDTLKLIACTALAEALTEIYPDSAIYYAEKVILLSRKLKLKLEEAYGLGQMGYALTNLGNYPRALQTLLTEIAIAGNPANEKNVLPATYENSDELNSRSVSPRNQRLDKLARGHQYIGILYSNAPNYEKAKFHYLQAKHLAEQTGNVPLQSTINGTLGRIYLDLKMPDSALITEQKAYDQAIQSGYIKYRGSILFNFAKVHSAVGHKKLAAEYFKKALTASGEQNYLRGVIAADLSLADLYMEAGKRDSGLYYINAGQAVAQQLNAPSLLLRVYKALASYYTYSGKSDSTVKYQQLVIKINDSLFNSKQVQQFQNIDFDAQQRQQEIQAAETEYKNRLQKYLLLGGLAVFLIVAVILFRNNKQKQKANKVLENTLSHLKSAQAQLIQSEKMASLGELTAGIAHEIQNPLNFVNNFSEVNKELIVEMKNEINAGNLNEAKNIAKDIEDNEEKIIFHGKRADGIVKGMLQHSRSSTGIKEPTDINALADEYLRLAYHGLRAKNKTFNARFETDFDISLGKVNIIPQDIGRVMLNLINNAFYAVSEKQKQNIPAYEPTVTVITKQHADKIELKVIDNGNGVPQKILDKIFQPFFTTKPTGQGTGLGLSLCYDIVKAHGGEIKVETKGGEQTEFIIQLPVK